MHNRSSLNIKPYNYKQKKNSILKVKKLNVSTDLHVSDLF